MTEQEKNIIKREIIIAYFKLSSVEDSAKRTSIAIQMGLNEAERKMNKERGD